jgi:hypothetical protein
MRPNRTLLRLLIIASIPTLSLILMSGDATSTVVCENLSGNTIIVGEMRYHVWSGDACYANSYWDGAGGDELDLTCGGRAGGLSGANTTTVGAYAYLIDQDTTDSDTGILFRLRLHGAATCNGADCSGTNTTNLCGGDVTWTLDTDDPPGTCAGVSCEVRAGKMLTCSLGSGIVEAFVEVDDASGSCGASDVGCFDIRGTSCSYLTDF